MPASEEIVEVAPNVLRAQLPIDLTGLGHVNCYILEDERGCAIVDPGMPGPKTFKVLGERLTDAGYPMRRVHTVIVTHSHPDHYGGAGWVRRASGAEIVTHERFRMMWDPSEPPDLDVEDVAELSHRPESRRPWDPPPWGGEGYPVPWQRRFGMGLVRRFPKLSRTTVPTRRLVDAEVIRLARREWVSLHTPGHTDDHLCLFDPEAGVMLSGDHVLPTITPHIGGFVRDLDPLARFFESLDKVAEYGPDVGIALPAHGQTFDDLAGRAMAIKAHHIERLDVLRGAATDVGRPATVNELAQRLFSERAQGPMADSETFAHLEHLRWMGEVERIGVDRGYRYVPVG